MAFVLKRGDTYPSLQASLTDDNGAVNLTGCTVRFIMRPAYCDDSLDCDGNPVAQASSPTVNAPATIVSATAGTVAYGWQSADTQTPGDYNGEFQVTNSGGGVTTYPETGYIPITINPNLS